MTAILASEPSSIGRVLDQAFRLFRVGVGGLLPYTIAAAVVSLMLQLLQARALARVGAPGAALALPRISPAFALLLLVAVLAFLIIHMAALHRLAALDAGTGSNGESWRVGLNRTPALIGATLLLGLLLGLTFGLLFGIGGGMATAGGGGAVALLGIVIVTVAILGAIYVFVRVMYYVPEIVLRSAGPMDSLRGTWRITRGHFWRISILVGVLVLAMIVLYVILLAVAAAVLAVLGGTGRMTVDTTVLVTQVLSSLLVVLTLPLSLATTLAIWHDLRLRSEGTDIAARIDKLPPRS